MCAPSCLLEPTDEEETDGLACLIRVHIFETPFACFRTSWSDEANFILDEPKLATGAYWMQSSSTGA